MAQLKVEREREKEEKAIALCNQLSLWLFLAFSLPMSFSCFVVSLTPGPHLEQVRLKASLVYKAPYSVRDIRTFSL